jgi:hypothetical protein
MAHFTAPDVTANATTMPSSHAGINSHTSRYSFAALTASGSQSVAMMALPAGARIRGGHFSTNIVYDGDIAVVITTGDTRRAAVIQTASGAAALQYNPDHLGNNYLTTASSHVRVLLKGGVSTSASVTLAMTLLYTTQDDPGAGSSTPSP